MAHDGFMEAPDVPGVLEQARGLGFDYDPEDVTYFLGRERLLASQAPGGMALWREKLFALMSRNALQATQYFRIPPEKVIEVGAQIEL